MICLRIWVLTVLCTVGLLSFAQSGNDVILTKKGVTWKGKVVTEEVNDTVTLLTKDNVLHYFAYKDIADIKYGSGNETSATSSAKEAKIALQNLPENIEKRRRVGLGLTIVGALLTAGGTIMIAAKPGNTTTYSASGAAGIHFSNVAAVGVVLDLAGVPMLIVGAVKLAKANKLTRHHLKATSAE